MSLLANLQKRKSQSLEAITKSLESGGGSGGSKKEADPRFWKPTFDDNGNFAAVIRFLPNIHEEDELPWVKVDTFSFKGPSGKYLYANSPATLGRKCPIKEDNYHLWNVVGTEEAKNIVRNRKVKPRYTSNIYVVRDPNNPEAEGKVFLFEYGKQVFGMIQAKAKPEEDPLGDTPDPVFVWDLYEGANFRFRGYTEKGANNTSMPKYDKSSFDAPSALLEGDEEKLEDVLSKCHQLKQFLAEDLFESYDDLKARLDKVMGAPESASNGKGKGGKSSSKSLDDSSIEDELNRLAKDAESSTPKKKVSEKKKDADPAPSGDDGDDLEYFKSLLNDD